MLVVFQRKYKIRSNDNPGQIPANQKLIDAMKSLSFAFNQKLDYPRDLRGAIVGGQSSEDRRRGLGLEMGPIPTAKPTVRLMSSVKCVLKINF